MDKMVMVPRVPTKEMLRAAAKAMSPAKRPTQEWMSVSAKHSVRYSAMIRAFLESAGEASEYTPEEGHDLGHM